MSSSRRRGHPREVVLLAVAAGRRFPDEVAAARAQEHLTTGCSACQETIGQLRAMGDAILDDHEFDEFFEGLDGNETSDRRDTASTDPWAVSADSGAVLCSPSNALFAASVDRSRFSAAAAGREIAAHLERLAEGDPDAAVEDVRSLVEGPSRGYALLYLCQKCARLVPRDPAGFARLAAAISDEAARLPAGSPSSGTAGASRDLVLAEAALVSCQALHHLGHTAEARAAARQARDRFGAVGDLGFGLALCDYFEGYCASFQRDYVASERLLRAALKTFAEFGQDHWVGRALSAYGTLLAQRGNDVPALPLYEEALQKLDPELDVNAYGATLVNKASALAHAGRFDDARATYATALSFCMRHGLDYSVHLIRNGLAEIEFRRGDLARAYDSFRKLAARAKEEGLVEDYLFAQLYVAECLGRLGREAEMQACVRTLRDERRETPFGPSPAFEELFTCLDRGDLDAGLIAHVREFLDGQDEGAEVYRPLRIVRS